MRRVIERAPTWLVYLAGLVPLGLLVWATLSNTLGPDPVKAIERDLGKTALWLLALGLMVTPLRPWLDLLRFRRALGLLAFLYVSLHLTVWVWLDLRLLWGQALGELVKRPYLNLGILAFVLMIPLALTSNRWAIRRLRHNWGRLHRLTYAIALLAVVHYLMQMKVISTEGWVWALGVGALLGLRVKRSVGRG